MKIFSPRHFLRHVSAPTLREFTQAHLIASYLPPGWDSDDENLTDRVNTAVDSLQTTWESGGLTEEEASAVSQALHWWHDDLRRVHLHQVAVPRASKDVPGSLKSPRESTL